MVASGAPADLVESFSFAFPAIIICELLGIPAADRHAFRGWTDAIVSTATSTPAQAQDTYPRPEPARRLRLRAPLLPGRPPGADGTPGGARHDLLPAPRAPYRRARERPDLANRDHDARPSRVSGRLVKAPGTGAACLCGARRWQPSFSHLPDREISRRGARPCRRCGGSSGRRSRVPAGAMSTGVQPGHRAVRRRPARTGG